MIRIITQRWQYKEEYIMNYKNQAEALPHRHLRPLTSLTSLTSFISLIFLIFPLSSCRDSADDVYDFSGNNTFTFDAAGKSLAGQFDALWMAMNSNYSLWDVEQREYGLNWDAVYDKYMPRFQQLDARYAKDSIDVPDTTLLNIYNEILSPLHDGHLTIILRNVRNKSANYLTISPGRMRVQRERPEEYNNALAYTPSLAYYNKEGRLDRERSLAVNVDGRDYVILTLLEAIAVAEDSIAAGSARAQRFQLAKTDLLACLQMKQQSDATVMVQEYEKMRDRYTYLGFRLPSISNDCNTGKLSIISTVIDGSIPYLYISGFNLSTFFDENMAKKFKEHTFYDYYQSQVKAVWQSWYDSIQRLYASGTLKGVIVDVRSNGGGYSDDYKYVMGTLAGENTMLGYTRYKSGTARLDYSPLNKCYAEQYPGSHARILGDERYKVVVLANARTVSMAEVTSLATKYYSNAYLVGQRTHGGLCMLIDGNGYDYTYSGIVGEANVTPFYGYIPCGAMLNRDRESLEGIGIAPDYNVPLDVPLFKSTKQDTQLDKAIEIASNPNPAPIPDPSP